MNSRILFLACVLAVSTGVLSACGREAGTKPEPPRAVKLEVAGAGASAQTLFVASVRQEQRAELAFENGGRIASIDVDVGDRVRQGQVLARLDPQPAQLRLQQAEANLRAATAQWRERQTQMRQQQAMFDDGAISQATLTGAQVALDAAQAQVHVAESDRDLAARALRQSALRAPFDGSVVARLQQPQADAAAGQAVLQLEGEGRPQAVAMLPAEVAQALTPGAQVQSHRADAPQATFALRVRGVSARVESGAGMQVIFDVVEAAAPLRSGDSLVLALGDAQAGILSVPLTAVVPHLGHDSAVLFVYRPADGAVERRNVTLGAVQGGRVRVLAGLAPREQVVASGAAFLSDGQKVLPFRSETRLSGGRAP